MPRLIVAVVHFEMLQGRSQFRRRSTNHQVDTASLLCFDPLAREMQRGRRRPILPLGPVHGGETVASNESTRMVPALAVDTIIIITYNYSLSTIYLTMYTIMYS